MPKGMGYWKDYKFPKPKGGPNPFGHGTMDDTPTGVPVDKVDPTIPASTNMMGQMIENEQPTKDQTSENIRKGNV